MESFVQRNFYEDGFYANIVIDSQNNPWFRSSLFFKTIALNNNFINTSSSDFIVYKAFNKKLFINKQSLLNMDEYRWINIYARQVAAGLENFSD